MAPIIKIFLKANKTEMSISVIIPRGIVVSFLIKPWNPTNIDDFSIASNYSFQKIKFCFLFYYMLNCEV